MVSSWLTLNGFQVGITPRIGGAEEKIGSRLCFFNGRAGRLREKKKKKKRKLTPVSRKPAREFLLIGVTGRLGKRVRTGNGNNGKVN